MTAPNYCLYTEATFWLLQSSVLATRMAPGVEVNRVETEQIIKTVKNESKFQTYGNENNKPQHI